MDDIQAFWFFVDFVVTGCGWRHGVGFLAGDGRRSGMEEWEEDRQEENSQ